MSATAAEILSKVGLCFMENLRAFVDDLPEELGEERETITGFVFGWFAAIGCVLDPPGDEPGVIDLVVYADAGRDYVIEHLDEFFR